MSRVTMGDRHDQVDKGFAIRMFRGVKRIRLVEEGIAERYGSQQMRCPTHLSIGQEGAAIGVCSALESTDLAVSTHRAHAHYLAKGGNLKAMLAEIYGKRSGCSGGRGGSMHLVDRQAGFMGSTAIVANSIPVGVGLGLSLEVLRSNAISVVFFGEGATEEGAFYEAVNFAAVRQLPVLFVCENNLYSVYSPLRVRQPEGRDICRLAEAMGVPASREDGNDAVNVYLRTRDIVRATRGGGPHLLELPTYRWREHCGPGYDNHIGYRTEAEFEQWRERDPVAILEKQLTTNFNVSESEIDDITVGIEREVANAFDFAETEPFPEPHEAYQGLFAESAELR